MGSSTDIHPPKIHEAKRNVHKHEMTPLDDALEDTFPASDPPAIIEPHRHLGSGKKSGHAAQSASEATGTSGSEKK